MKKFYLALVIFSLTGQVAWVVENMYLNVFIYNMFQASAQDISLMVASSAISATVTTLLVGALSDKVGKRKIFICLGYILWGISILSFALIRLDVITALFPATASAAAVGVTLVIIMDCVMTFFGSSANDACFNAWLTDSTDHTNRGKAEGINAMMPLVAILAVFGGFMGLDQKLPESWTVIFCVIGGIVTLLGILGFFLIEERTVKNDENKHFLKNLIYGFRPAVIRENPGLYLTLLAFAVFGVAINIFMPYLLIYYQVSLQLGDTYVLIFAPAIIMAAAFTAIYGRVYDRLGFTKSILPAMGLLMSGFAILYAFHQPSDIVLVFIGTVLMLCGYLAGMAVFGAMLRDNTPAGKAGMFQGQRIIGQVLLPGVIGPAIGAAVLSGAEQITNSDGTVSFVPNEYIFLAALGVAVLVLISLIPLTKKRAK